MKFLKKFIKNQDISSGSKDTAKERLHLVLMQDRANVSADFLDLMKQEIIDVIKKYIEVDESAIDVRLTNKENDDGTNGAPALYANIPIVNIKESAKVGAKKEDNNSQEQKVEKVEENSNKEEIKEEVKIEKNVNENNTEDNTKETEEQNNKPEEQPEKQENA